MILNSQSMRSGFKATGGCKVNSVLTLPRPEKWLSEVPRQLAVKSKLSLRSDSVALRYLLRTHKIGGKKLFTKNNAHCINWIICCKINKVIYFVFIATQIDQKISVTDYQNCRIESYQKSQVIWNSYINLLFKAMIFISCIYPKRM